MNKSLALLTVVLITTIATNAQQHTHSTLKNETDSMSYAIGVNVANSFLKSGLDTFNFDVLSEAMQDVIEHGHANMDAATATTILNEYLRKKQEKQIKAATADGAAFLAKNATKEGVKTTPSGLQYEVITEGTGAVPVDGQRVKTHYTGTLINGDVFDSSVERGTPATFGVNQVIKGWTEALKMMPVGSKWKLYIPYNLAYGERAMGAKIPPYSTLIFEIELLEIVQ